MCVVILFATKPIMGTRRLEHTLAMYINTHEIQDSARYFLIDVILSIDDGKPRPAEPSP